MEVVTLFCSFFSCHGVGSRLCTAWCDVGSRFCRVSVFSCSRFSWVLISIWFTVPESFIGAKLSICAWSKKGTMAKVPALLLSMVWYVVDWVLSLSLIDSVLLCVITDKSRCTVMSDRSNSCARESCGGERMSVCIVLCLLSSSANFCLMMALLLWIFSIVFFISSLVLGV